MPEENRDQRELLLRPFLILAVIVSTTAGLGILYLAGTLVISSLNSREAKVPLTTTPQQKVWVSKALTVCDEVWQQKKIEQEKYLGSLGVEIFDRITRVVPQTSQKEDCLRCSCLSGEILYLQVYKEALADLVGFVESGSPPKE